MPNRLIKESIKRSPQIDQLSWFDEVVFYRLIVTADDYGCCDGRPIVLRNDLFPTKENVTKKAIEDAISHLASVGLVRPYNDETSGMPYLFFPTWEKHQRVRNKIRKFPEPPKEAFLPVDSRLSATCCQMTADCLPESESNPNPNPNPNTPHTPQGGRFAEFWAQYPKKVGKGAAEKAFDRIKPDKPTFDRMMSAISVQKQSRQWRENNGQYIPNPATWLNQRRWEDELAGMAEVKQLPSYDLALAERMMEENA